jgi:pilus assembly protein CpaF
MSELGTAAATTTGTHLAAERLRTRLRTDLARRLTAHVDEEHAPVESGERRQLAVRLAAEITRAHTEAELMANRSLLDDEIEQRVVTEVLDETFGMAGLQPLLDNPQIENINVNGYDRVFVRYADGSRAQMPPVADSDDELASWRA